MSQSNDPASGTRDFLPDEMARRHRALTTIREVFQRYGFAPIDTPAFERLEVLMGKYGEEGDQLIFKILRRGEHEDTGEADLALRYDLTVPLARFVANNLGDLGTPFKRHHIGPVWRADRPGHGRFREFLQCDIDTVGSDSPMADAETILAITEALEALGVGDFTVQLNSRHALRGLIEVYGVPADLEESALVALDKLDKIGPDGVIAELEQRGVPAGSIGLLSEDLAADDLTGRVRDRLGGSDRGVRGLGEVDTVLDLLEGHLAGGGITFSPLLARGLSYYTGPIFEITHTDLGSTIAAGGRYDELVGMFMGQDMPSTGGSIGLERVLLLLAEEEAAASAPVVVTVFDEDGRRESMDIAMRLRRAGVGADLFAADSNLGKQFRYADRRGARVALIRGPDERAAGTVAVKDLVSGEQQGVPLDDVVERVRGVLDAG